MAPPPEYDKEPKAPDKSLTGHCSEDSKEPHNLAHDLHYSSDSKSVNTTATVETEDNKHVGALDDGQLRALLDEAITYKCPKDREGKSSLFKELLEEVEQDEQACEEAARSWGGSGRGGARGVRAGGGRSRRALPHSNSLQDLVEALSAEPPRRRPPPAQVSARTHHGGSLPSGVDTSFLLSEEPSRTVARTGGVEYVATVRCENPSPLAERRVSASDAEADALNRRSKMAAIPMTYTARATLEIGSGSVSSGRAVTTTTASNQVDSGIPFSCITTPEVVTSCNTTSSTAQAVVAVDQKQSFGYRGVNSLAGAWDEREETSPAAASNTDDIKQKSLDENGNSVQGISSPQSGSSQHKKPRRKKSSKNETVIKSHQIDGYQGNKDLNELLRFIESNEEQGRGAKLGRVHAKHKDDSDDKNGKKRSTDRRKDKENRMKRANSMEELSRTKLEDLTDKPEMRRGKKDAVNSSTTTRASERRSWGDDARDSSYYYEESASETNSPPAPIKEKKKAKPSKSVDSPSLEPHSDTALEMMDFQTVTKKKKQRKRLEDSAGGGAGRGGMRAASPPRRKSAPPSDKSGDSNDDMDSVHSLPAAPPPPPHASYADIARTRHNIPDLIESCNYYVEESEVKQPAAPVYDADSYPALETRRARRAGGAGGGKPRAQPDVVADRPPAVVLRAAGGADLDGVTFGFDVNEQLLRTPRRCDLLHHYVPPPPPPLLHHTQLVDYVGHAWEDVIKCGEGKVRYFSE